MGGGTFRHCTGRLSTQNFNPPSPWGEGPKPLSFRSAQAWYFNPPSPWGEGPEIAGVATAAITNFNPPSPWGEGLFQIRKKVGRKEFQSTLPVGGGTSHYCTHASYPQISIHPPRGGRDIGSVLIVLDTAYFNPPSPWGEGQQKYTKILLYFMHF